MTPRDRRMLAAAERLAAAILADRQACAAYNLARALGAPKRGPIMSAAVATQRAAAVEVGWAHEEIVRTSRLRPRWKDDKGDREV